MRAVMEKPPTIKEKNVRQCVDECVQQQLNNCAYRFIFCKISWQFKSGKLSLNGQVPSFYLKQVLQELMRGIKHVDQIVNDVDVVSSNGLSSTKPK